MHLQIITAIVRSAIELNSTCIDFVTDPGLLFAFDDTEYTLTDPLHGSPVSYLLSIVCSYLPNAPTKMISQHRPVPEVWRHSNPCFRLAFHPVID